MPFAFMAIVFALLSLQFGCGHPNEDNELRMSLEPSTTCSMDAGKPKDAGAKDAGIDASDAAPSIDAGQAEAGSGCGLPAQGGSFALQTTDGNGTMRSYEIMVPSPYNPNTPLDVTFAYHGAGATESQSIGWGIQNAPGAAAASIFVFPQGINYQNYGIGWDDSCGGYDMVFFDHMLAYIEQTYCVDSTRIFAAGFSWGCDYVTGLRCCRGTRLRATANASCSDDFNNLADYTTYINLPCPALGTAGIRFTHDANGDPSYSLQDFTTTSALYRSFNTCTSTSSPTSPSPCEAYQGCDSPYIECPYPGLGHAVPSTFATDTWSFFASF